MSSRQLYDGAFDNAGYGICCEDNDDTDDDDDDDDDGDDDGDDDEDEGECEGAHDYIINIT